MVPSFSTASTLLAHHNPLNTSAMRGPGWTHPPPQLGSSQHLPSGGGSFSAALGQHLPFYTHLGSDPEDISVEYLKSGLTQLHEAVQAWALLAVRPRVMLEDLAFHLLTTHLDMFFATLSRLDASHFERAVNPTFETQCAWNGVWTLLPTVTNRWNEVRSLFDAPSLVLDGGESTPPVVTAMKDGSKDGLGLVQLVSQVRELSITAAYSDCFSSISLSRRVGAQCVPRRAVTTACVTVAVALAVVTVLALWMPTSSSAASTWSAVGTATSLVLTLLCILCTRDAHDASRRAREFFALLRVPQQRRTHIPLETWSEDGSATVPMSGVLHGSSASMARAPSSPLTARASEPPSALGSPSITAVLQREFVAIVVDNDGLIQYWSPGAEAATGFGRNAVERHKYLHEVLHQRSYKILYPERDSWRMNPLVPPTQPTLSFRFAQLHIVLIASSKDRRVVVECTWRQLQPNGDRYLCGYVVGNAFPRASQYFASMYAAMLDELCIPEAHDPPLVMPPAATTALRNISSMMQSTGYQVERSLASWDEARMEQISMECTRALSGDFRSSAAVSIRNADAGTIYLDLVMLRRALATVVSELRQNVSGVSVGLHPVEGIECLPNAQHLSVIFQCCPPGFEDCGALDGSAAQSVIQKLEQKNLGVGVLRWTAKELHVAVPASRSRFAQHPSSSNESETSGNRLTKQKQNHPSFVIAPGPAREREIEDHFLIAVVEVDPIAFGQLEAALCEFMPNARLLLIDTVRDFFEKLDSRDSYMEAAFFAADQFSALKELIEAQCAKRGIVVVRLDPSSHAQNNQVFQPFDNQLRLTLPIRYDALEEIAKAVRTQRETNWNKMQNEEFMNDEVIGRGATSTVYRAHGKVTGSIVAVKHYRQSEGHSNEGNIECAIYQRLREVGGHPNILQFITLKHDREIGTRLVLQFCPGSLQKELQNKPPLELAVITNLFRQCLEAVAFLHDHDVVHRDIKPDNFLLDGDVVRMNDFGSALQVVDGEMPWIPREVLGTGFSPLYAPPESAVTTVPTKGMLMARDIWACGMLLLSMLKAVPKELSSVTTRHAFFRDKKMPVYLNSCKFHYTENGVIREDASKPLLLNFLKQMLETDPLRRPTARQLLDHEWFRQTRPRRDMFSSGSSSGGMPIASLSDGQRPSNPAAAYFNSVARRSVTDVASISASHLTKEVYAARDSVGSSVGDLVAQPLEFPPDLGPR